MTEQEWLTCTDPAPMLEFLRGKASDRKLRLFCVVCCRTVAHLFDAATYYDAEIRATTQVRSIIDVWEQHADGLASETELSSVRSEAARAARGWAFAAMHAADVSTVASQRFLDALCHAVSDDPGNTAESAAVTSGYDALVRDPDSIRAVADAYESGRMDVCEDWEAGETMVAATPTYRVAYAAEQAAQVRVIRCLIGNPFRPVRVDPDWLRWCDGAIVHRARAIYDERRFQDLPVLAGALEEAGCTDPEILGHCRGPGQHVRGCWPVDLIIGKG